jgi:hypothetical protein
MEDYYGKLKQDIANPDLDAGTRQNLNESIQAYERYRPQQGPSTPSAEAQASFDKYLASANPRFGR